MLRLVHQEDSPKASLSWPLAAACFIWVAMFSFVAVRASHFVFDANECLTYGRATQNWWAHQPLYKLSNIDGYLYVPQFAILFSPFALAGHPVGDVIWRFAGLCLFCSGLWRAGRLLLPAKADAIFAIATLIAFAPTFNALRNAQVNLHLAGLMLHTAVDLARKNWWCSAIWLTLGLALKPIIIAPLLLSAACYRQTIPRLIVCLLVFALFPFAFAPPDYCLSQLYLFWEKLIIAAQPDRLFSDLRSLIAFLGFMIPMNVYFLIQIIAALATLALALLAIRRWREPAAAVFLLALSASYLMLFNTRTEGNSYVILTPLFAIPAALLFVQHRRLIAASLLTFLTIWLTGNLWAYRLTVHWLKPLACIIFTVLLVRELLYGDSSNWPISAPKQSPGNLYLNSHGAAVRSPAPQTQI
jgi:hypothetical protein